MATEMDVLVGTGAGLVDPISGQTVAFPAREVTAVSGPWVVLDGHRAWSRYGVEGPSVEPEINCIEALAGEEALVGTAEAHVFRLGDTANLVESFEGVVGRDEWYTPWGGPPDVRSISSSSGTVLVNVHVGGILRSPDRGASWEPTIDLEHDVHQVLAVGDGRAVAACAHGLAMSEDDGRTWTLHDQGMHATYSRAVAVTGQTVLLSASTGPRGHHAAIYRRSLTGDGELERCRKGLPDWLEGNIDTSWLAGSSDGRAAFATGSGEVYLSNDEGGTWERAASVLPPVRCLTVG